ncbi:SET domain-containing protein SmydA-8 [Onthophagus taurus]|uniref:SET domain-containing protein SmydA-8 n=1 Tax=Onthophagus taurus TaxID=166361 RepID=UPI0039BE27CD
MSSRKKRSKCSKSRSKSVSSLNGERFEEEKINPNEDVNNDRFNIKTSKIMGRYIVASKDLNPGEIILSEAPLVVGPCAGCKVICIACYQLLENSNYAKCFECGWPLCKSTCSGINKKYGHTQEECLILKSSKSEKFLNYKDFDRLQENFQAIVPLRCLILKESDPKTFEKIAQMESHETIRKCIPDLWSLDKINVIDRIRLDWGLKEFSEEEIHRICGILEVNCFEIGQNSVSIRGLYPQAFLMSHDCIPNTSHSDEEDFKLTVRASVKISKNQPITLSYAYTLQGTLKRREHLLENKFFECKCLRCKDPTELGTNLGALICPKCKRGSVLPSDPLNCESSWSCNNKSQKCPGYTVTSKSMKLLINRIQSEIDEIDCNDVKKMEYLLEKYRNVLHPNHYLCLSLKLSLSQLYGKINGFLIHELTDELLERKIEICREILKIFDVLEPGYTRIRGVTLYELHAPIMIMVSRKFEKQQITKSELKNLLREVVRYLEEASVILSYEPSSTSEGIMGIAAKEALGRIKDWGNVIGRI